MSSDTTTNSPNFISLDEAAAMTEGTRITFIPGVQALFAEALKNICFVKGIPVIRALHPLMGVDKETGQDRQARLYELTSQTGLPTMFYAEERPRNVWTEQLALAERIGSPSSPSLIPENFAQRVDMFGLCAVVLAEDGIVWNMRILNDGALGRKYGYEVMRIDNRAAGFAGQRRSPRRLHANKGMLGFFALIDNRLAQQSKSGVRVTFWLGMRCRGSADIYWATMSMSVTATPPNDKF